MLPALFGSTFGIIVASVEVLAIAGTAGMGYGLGRKYGRRACQVLDRVEERVFDSLKAKSMKVE